MCCISETVHSVIMFIEQGNIEKLQNVCTENKDKHQELEKKTCSPVALMPCRVVV